MSTNIQEPGSENFPVNVLLTGDHNSPFVNPSCQHPAHDGSWGVDTIEIWAHLADDDYYVDERFWKTRRTVTKSGELHFTHTLKYEYKGQTVTIAISTKHNKCYISLNAAKLSYSDHLSLGDPSSIHQAALAFLTEIKPFLCPSEIWNKAKPGKPLHADWQLGVRVSRIDFARNFFIQDTSFRSFLQGLSHFGKTRHISEKSKEDGWSITHQTKSTGKDMFYNKTAELLTNKKVQVEPGHYRFETQLRKSRKKKAGLMNLASVTSETAWSVLEWRWVKTSWGQPTNLSSLNSVIAAKYPKEACHLIGYITMKEQGLEPGNDQKTLKKYDLKIAEIIQEAAISDVQHLDLYTGTLKSISQIQNSEGAPVNSEVDKT